MTRRKTSRVLVAALLTAFSALLWPSHGAAQDKGEKLPMRIVVNAEGAPTRVSREDLVRIFLGKKTIWESGARIAPAMIEEEAGTMQPFMDRVLKKTVEQYRTYWKRLLFSGGGTAPRTFRNSSQVIEFVAKQPGAIGVVEPSANDDRVKTVEVEG